jgi:hypothetical protein
MARKYAGHLGQGAKGVVAEYQVGILVIRSCPGSKRTRTYSGGTVLLLPVESVRL